MQPVRNEHRNVLLSTDNTQEHNYSYAIFGYKRLFWYDTNTCSNQELYVQYMKTRRQRLLTTKNTHRTGFSFAVVWFCHLTRQTCSNQELYVQYMKTRRQRLLTTTKNTHRTGFSFAVVWFCHLTRQLDYCPSQRLSLQPSTRVQTC